MCVCVCRSSSTLAELRAVISVVETEDGIRSRGTGSCLDYFLRTGPGTAQWNKRTRIQAIQYLHRIMLVSCVHCARSQIQHLANRT